MPGESAPLLPNVCFNDLSGLWNAALNQPQILISPEHVKSRVWVCSRDLQQQCGRGLAIEGGGREVPNDEVYGIGILLDLNLEFLSERSQLLLKLWWKQR